MQMKKKYTQLLLVVTILLFNNTQSSTAQSLEKQIDALFQKEYKVGEPGAVVLIAKNGKAIYRKAFGMANLELSIPMKPENVLELGSITKQFTAVSILMLMEQGKLSLEDPLSTFIPDYPNGEKITVHHLLNHTSGIKSMTDMPNFLSLARKDMTLNELIDVFKNEPVTFAPGEEYAYNNSAYILLGAIIETTSKMSYEDFIEKNIFAKLGMKNSYYGSKGEIIPNRASGYKSINNKFENADYLSMTIPYAAGSLMSCVDDMLVWSEAIHHNKLISEKSKQLAFSPNKTNNGEVIYYGYGWGINEIDNIQTLEHSGGIFGYTTFGLYVPKENLYVIVLTNTDAIGPSNPSVKAAAVALGKPFKINADVKVSQSKLTQWIGAYEFEDKTIRFITFKDGNLYSQRKGGNELKLITLSETEFNFENTFTTYKFTIENGKRVAFFADRINKSKGVETIVEPELEKASITVSSDILQNYVGKYQLQPGFEIDITSQNQQLFGQATGQGKFELFAETENTFFAKITELKVIFNKDSSGKIVGFSLDQAGRVMELKKIN